MANIKEIGSPFKYASHVDPNDRAYNFLKSKMTIVDLYPNAFGVNFTAVTGAISNFSLDSLWSGCGPVFDYSSAMERYKGICKEYGLPEEVDAIRLYLTDETVGQDQITNDFQENFFQKALDGLRSAAQTISMGGRSIFTNYDQVVSNTVDKVKNWTNENVIHGFDDTVGIDQAKTDKLMDTLAKGAKIVLEGKKISLPKMWADSRYNPVFSAQIKLMSPYGHPAAIKKYIIEPLMYLLILSAPKTTDGVSYGYPFTLTVKAYGRTRLNLAYIKSISIQKGGNGTIFNAYKQPLVVNVALEFESVIEGFAAFEHGCQSDFDHKQFANCENIDSGDVGITDLNTSMLPTLGDMINILAPVNNMQGVIKSGQGSVRNLNVIGSPTAADDDGGGLYNKLFNTGKGLMDSIGLSGILKSAEKTIKDQVGMGGKFGEMLVSTVGKVGDIIKNPTGLLTNANELYGIANGIKNFVGSTIQGVCSGLEATVNFAADESESLKNDISSLDNDYSEFNSNIINDLKNNDSIYKTNSSVLATRQNQCQVLIDKNSAGQTKAKKIDDNYGLGLSMSKSCQKTASSVFSNSFKSLDNQILNARGEIKKLNKNLADNGIELKKVKSTLNSAGNTKQNIWEF